MRWFMGSGAMAMLFAVGTCGCSDRNQRTPGGAGVADLARDLPKPEAFARDDRVKALLPDRSTARQAAEALLAAKNPDAAFLGLWLAAALRDPGLYPAVKRLVVPATGFAHPPEKDTEHAMELAAQVDRERCLDDLIAVQEFRSTYDGVDDDTWMRKHSIADSAVRVLTKDLHRAPVLLQRGERGNEVKEALLPGYDPWTVADRARAMVKAGTIDRPSCNLVLVEVGDASVHSLVRDWLLLTVAMSDIAAARPWVLGDGTFEMPRCVEYLQRFRKIEPCAWLIMALECEALMGELLEYPKEDNAVVVPAFDNRGLIFSALTKMHGKRCHTAAECRSWFTANHGAAAFERAAGRMAELKAWWPKTGLHEIPRIPWLPEPPDGPFARALDERCPFD